MSTFNAEVTDTFGGELNYSWVNKYTVEAKSFRGAACIVSRQSGLRWKKQIECGDYAQYVSQSGATALILVQIT